ncbi:MAG: Crp/Fnr family transcriptional regulator [Myxococcota bacterium]
MERAEAVVEAVVSPLVTLSANERSWIAQRLRPYHCDANVPLFPLGVRCEHIVLLYEGLVRSYFVEAEGRESNQRFLGPPNVAVSLTSVITQEPAEVCVEAVTPVVGFRMSLADLAESPRFHELMRVLAEQHYLSMERRLRMLQHKFVRERYAFYRTHLDPAIVAGMPDFHVASYLGVSAEALSRAKRPS